MPLDPIVQERASTVELGEGLGHEPIDLGEGLSGPQEAREPLVDLDDPLRGDVGALDVPPCADDHGEDRTTCLGLVNRRGRSEGGGLRPLRSAQHMTHAQLADRIRVTRRLGASVGDVHGRLLVSVQGRGSPPPPDPEGR